MAGAPAEAPAEGGPPALGVAPPLAPAHVPAERRPPAGIGAIRGQGMWIATLAFAALICALSFYASGGLDLQTMTVAEIALTIGSGVILAAAALTLRRGARSYGAWPAGLLLGFALLSAVSIVWSVQPDASWRDAARLLAYAAVFAAAVALARVDRRRWPALLGGLALAAVVICAYALLAKSLPDRFPEANRYARLYEPFGYWNALGLTAAMGALCCMWLGARRSGHALLSALAYPAMGVLLLTLLLAYSRGALVALAVGLIAWFALVPLRLRGASVLCAGAVAAGGIAAWDFSNHALSSENVPVAQATSAGHELGALVLAMIALLTLVGVTVVFVTGRRPPAAELRRRAGALLLAALAAAILAFAGALAASHRGFTGTISHAVHSLTNTRAKVPNTPGRLTAIASVRAQYWDEALKVFKAHPVLGVGADGYEVARLRYRTGPLPVKHAHGFVVQTLADLGIVGILIALALLLAWAAAAGRGTHPFNRRWRSWRELREGARPAWRALDRDEGRRYGAERVGLLTMVCVVIVFGAHSLIDWTWYVPGDAITALVLAGWLAGRGPLRRHARAGATSVAGPSPAARDGDERRRTPRWAPGALGRPGPDRIALGGATVVLTLLAAWVQWQPLRSEDSANAALGALGRDPGAALADARSAVSRDPLSANALYGLSEVQSTSGRTGAARSTLVKAVRLQPSNPQTWLELGRFDLARDPRAALMELRAAVYLDPESISAEALAAGNQKAIETYNDYVQALRAVASSEQATLRSASERRTQAERARRAARRRARRSARSRTRR